MTPEQIRSLQPGSLQNVPPEVLRSYATPDNLSKLSPDQQAAVKNALGEQPEGPAKGESEKTPEQPSHTAPCLPGERCDYGLAVPSGPRRFGFDLFINPPSTFAPSSFIPVPVDYVIGPGDTIAVQLFGNQNSHFELPVQRDGSIQFPNLGPIPVAGLTFDDMRKTILDRIAKQMIGTEASITLGTLRSIQVFVVGDVKRPGAYTISSLSRMLNALFVSGGIADTGSFRHIELKRHGISAAELDLYDLLLKGDSSKDAELQPGDVIFVPPVGRSVTVTGSVLRPAIYELKGSERLSDVLAYAGGVTPEAYLRLTKVERIGPNDRHIVLDADPEKPGGNLALQNGDSITVTAVINRLDQLVSVKGYANRQQSFQWKPDLHISDVVSSPAALQPLADLNFALLVRSGGEDRRITVVKFRPDDVFTHRYGPEDLLLQPGDELRFFGYDIDRAKQLADVVKLLSTQARAEVTSPLISVRGAVQEPGVYPLVQNMSLQDAIDAAISVNKDAWLQAALVVRRDFRTDNIYVYEVSLEPGERDLHDFRMAPGDSLRVFGAADDRKAILEDVIRELKRQATPDQPAKIFTVGGEVKFPGDYPLVEGATVTKAIRLAGGFAEPAYPYNYEVTRQAVEPNGKFSIRTYAIDLSANDRSQPLSQLPLAPEVSRHVVEDDGKFRIQSVGSGSAQPVASAASLPSADMFALQARDTVVVRRQPNYEVTETVTLMGEVKFPGTYRARHGERLSDIVRRAGGFTDLADPGAAVFTREELRQEEELRFREIQEDVQREATRLTLVKTNAGSSGTVDNGQLSLLTSLSDKLATVHGLGRMVIDLPKITQGDPDADVQVRTGDVLRVPRVRQDVTIMGEVNYPTAHRFKPGTTAKEYIDQSGGFTQSADTGRVYVIRANGAVTASAVGWLSSSNIKPGDTIVVPVDLQPIQPLPLFTSLAGIVGNLAIAAASLKVVGGF